MIAANILLGLALVVLALPITVEFAAHVSRYRIRRRLTEGTMGATWGEDWKASR